MRKKVNVKGAETFLVSVFVYMVVDAVNKRRSSPARLMLFFYWVLRYILFETRTNGLSPVKLPRSSCSGNAPYLNCLKCKYV